VRIGIKAEAIHGNKSQNARQRALGNFKDRTTRVLVATDIAARGIDVDELSHVINYELPNIPETYVHRIGRTGRAGLSGVAFSFCEAEEVTYLKDIQKLIGKEIPKEIRHPYHIDLSNSKVPPPPQGGRQQTNRQQGNSRRPNNNSNSKGANRKSGNSRSYSGPKNY
jgi:ATP-dependent RNA helicase RhlE